MHNKNLSWLLHTDVQTLIQNLKSDSFKFVGGCVRDSIIGITPKDYDIATTYKPQEIVNLLESANLPIINVAIQYGTVTTLVGKTLFEITTLRADVKTFGRSAETIFIDCFRLDSNRRDFTINALYLNPINKVITDYHTGIYDLKTGNIRFIGNPSKRITEDYLRLLRFIRFYTYYGKKPIGYDYKKILKCHIKGLRLISKERIYNELAKILNHPRKIIGIKLLNQLGTSKILFKTELDEISLLKFNSIAKEFEIPSLSYEVSLFLLIINLSKNNIKINDLFITRKSKYLISQIIKVFNIVTSEISITFNYESTIITSLANNLSSVLLAKSTAPIIKLSLVLYLAKLTVFQTKEKAIIRKTILFLSIKEKYFFPVKPLDLIALQPNLPKHKIGEMLFLLKTWALKHNIDNKETILQYALQIINNL